MIPEEVPLNDTSSRRVVQIGDTVHRPTYPWSPSVHALLRHLERIGFGYAPRMLGVDDSGREVLSYIEGEAGPAGWAKVVDERGLRNAAYLLRHYHQAVGQWKPDESLLWPNGKQGAGDPGDVICHGDFGPWNIVWDGLRPVGLIDWDYAYPGPPSGDLVYALEYFVPFRDDAECLRSLAYETPPNRPRRLELFARAYGLTPEQYAGMPERVVEGQRAMLTQVRTLAEQGAEPQATWVRQGYLQIIEQRIRWCENNLQAFL